MTTCKVCNNKTQQIISFGKMPIANCFTKKSSRKEFVFTLKVALCPKCYMVQLSETVPPQKMFHENYQFFSSTSSGMAKHFKKQADHIKSLIKKRKDPFVVEIGSNDGIMIKNIANDGIRHLGVEPSKNVAKVSKKYGVNAISVFFNKKTAANILNKYSKADVISGSNVVCHIENINSVFEGVTHLLADNGIFFFEEPYLYDIIKNNSFDQIYDEHVYFYSGLSVQNLAKRHGLILYDMKHQDVHGGSMRYYLKKAGTIKPKKSVINTIAREKKLKLHTISGYRNFKKNIDSICHNLKKLLEKLRNKKILVAGYAATSKSTTFLNYAKIGKNLISHIYDTTPSKIGLFTPGTGIPVRSYEYFKKDFPEYTVLFAYNHKKEILSKEKDYRKNGGKFITYFPKVTID